MTEDQIAHMRDRFLSWKFPKNFRPDGGIIYRRPNCDPSIDATPAGSNLLGVTQAERMIRHLVEGLPAAEKMEPNPEWEARANALHAEATVERGIEPEATLGMLEAWKSVVEPANELGQSSFTRAMLDSAVDSIRKLLNDRAALQYAVDNASAALAGMDSVFRVQNKDAGQ